MEGDEYTDRVAENVVEFQQFVDEAVEAIDQDENFSDMTAESYEQKKSYMKSHIMELSQLHNSLADEYAELIEEVSKNCPSLFQNLHVESSESSSSPQVTQTLAPNFSVATGFDVLWQPGGGGFYLSKVEGSSHSCLESSMSHVNKPPVAPVIDDALKVKETKDSGSESSMSSVNKPPVAPVIDDALKVKETKDSGSESSMSSVNKPPVAPVIDDALKVKETKGSGSESSISSVNKTPVPPVNDDALNVKETKDSGSDCEALEVEETKHSGSESSISKPLVPPVNDDDLKLEETKDSVSESSISKPPVPPVNDNDLKLEETKDSSSDSDALKVEETKNSGSESSISMPPVPPVNDDDLELEETKDSGSDSDALKVEETKDSGSESVASKVGESKDSGSESSMSSVNKPEVPSDSDGALKVEKTKEHEVLLEKVSNLEEEVVSLKQKVKSLRGENGELKQEIEENIRDIGMYMSGSKLEIKAMEEDLQASKKFAKTIDEHMCRVLAEKISNQTKHDREINEMNTKMNQYINEISQLKSTHEKKEKIWNGVTGKLKDEINAKGEMVEVLSKNIEALILDKSSQNKLIHQLKTELESVKFENAGVLPSFDNVQKITDELKVKLVELEKGVDKQMEAMSETDVK